MKKHLITLLSASSFLIASIVLQSCVNCSQCSKCCASTEIQANEYESTFASQKFNNVEYESLNRN